MMSRFALHGVAALLVLQALAFWPVWQWYLRRMVDGSDEPFGVLALLSAIAIILARRSFARRSTRSPSMKCRMR